MSIVIIEKERFGQDNKQQQSDKKNLASYPTVQVINLAGHAVNDAMGFISYPSEKMMVARCSYNKIPVAQTVAGGIIYEYQYISISGLPEERAGVKYIVSAPVLNAALSLGRSDCIAVNDVIRHRDGHVMGCKGFRSNG